MLIRLAPHSKGSHYRGLNSSQINLTVIVFFHRKVWNCLRDTRELKQSCVRLFVDVAPMELAEVRKKLLAYRPGLVSRKNRRTAAVALILRQQIRGAEVLFIERSRRVDDPWSGQMAFPGGKTDPSDNISIETALRETHEEVGIRLDPSMSIGCLDDLVAPPTSPAHGLVVSCHAFVLDQTEPIQPNSEVHDTVWIPIDWMLDSDSFIQEFRPRDYEGSFPGIRVGRDDDRVIWGLTFRFVEGFLGILRPDFSLRT